VVRIASPSRRRGRTQSASAYAKASLPGRRTPWRKARWCALDLELTGLDPTADEIISFGAIPIEGGRVQLAEAVYELVRPVSEITEESIRVHGIRAVDLANAPSLQEAIETLLDVIAGRILVVHTAAIERSFLGRALRRDGLRLRGPLVDTEVLGRLWLHERDGNSRRHVSLTELASLLGLPADRPHDALGDALTTAQVFIALATHLEAGRAETVGSLARATARLESMRLLHWG
jgi:DNA polymerase III subunit epsilon